MHGLINRSIQRFVVDEYGAAVWGRVARQAALGFADFEAMWVYEDALTDRVLQACCAVLGRGQPEVMEDIGTYLVAHPSNESLRRLLRFGGVTFSEFLLSLDEVPQRASLAIAQLDIPPVEICEVGPLRYGLSCGDGVEGYVHLIAGVLRAMADDYGALALVEVDIGGAPALEISLLEPRFAAPKAFDLGRCGG